MTYGRRAKLAYKTLSQPVLVTLMICSVLLGVWAPIAQAVDPCFDDGDATTQTPSTTSGMSACQKYLYQKGIYAFDVAVNNQNCVVETTVELGGGDKPQAFYN